MTTLSNFAVRRIFETDGNYSQVSVDSETFNKVRGLSPEIKPSSTGRNRAGKGIRVFDINDVKLMSQYDKDSRKTSFVMLTAEAEAYHQPLDEGVPFDFEFSSEA